MNTFDDVYRPSEADRAHLFTGRAGIWLPAGQALITALLFGGGFASLVYVAEVDVNPAKVFLVAVTFIASIMWAVLLGMWVSLTAPIKRQASNFYQPNELDPEPGELEPGEPELIKVILQHDSGRTQFIDLPCPERLPEFSAGLLSGYSFSENTWSGAGALFSKSEFHQIRNEFIARELAVWKNPSARAQGVELTPAGWQVVKTLANRAAQSD